MFESERLILRPILLEDTEKLFEYRSRVRDNEYQSFVPTSIEEVREFIQKCSQEFNVSDTWFQLVIIIKEDNNLIGDIGVHFIDDEQVEFGITLNKEFQNNGYAFEAITYLFDILFNQFNKHRITASVDPRNINSIKLLKKLKMRKEAHHIKSYFFKDEWVDDCIYAILKEEFILL
jgi:RimJ/RimL family protein N-acetyltransferase